MTDGEVARLPGALDGDSIVLRRWRSSHLERLMQAIERSQPELGRWLPWAVEMPTVDAERWFLGHAERTFDSGAEFAYGVFEADSEELVGGVGLRRRSAVCMEIGYWTRTDRTGRGIATRAAGLVTVAAFDHLPELERLEIQHDVANRASAAIPPKLGYRLDREIDRPVLTPGHTGRGLLWSRTRPRRPRRPEGGRSNEAPGAEGNATPSEAVAAAYDAVAVEYEERFLDELAGKPRDRQLLDAFADAVSDPVLDVGSGPGQIGQYVRERGRLVTAVDKSREMSRLAAHRLRGAVTADLRALPVATASVGGILAFYSLIHLPRTELDGALTELRRVLRPRGRLLVSAHEGDGETEVHEFLGRAVQLGATFFTLDELVAAGTRARFEVLHAERRPPYMSEGSTVRLYVELRRPGHLP
jgi:RimJ/RimL family protein N-acetyltransferase/SAM-dependent methyltransferase